MHMTANNPFLQVQPMAGVPATPMEEGPIQDKAIGFYWDIFQLPNKDAENHGQRSSFWLSFEDDFDENLEDEFQEDDYFGDDAFLPRKDLFQEEEGLFEEEDGLGMGLRNELFYK